MLEERGAVAFDADDFARRAVDPGTPGFFQVVEAFGEAILGDEGDVDREALAAVVFRDPDARRRLEAIVHPEVARLFQESVATYRDTDRVVVYSVPLLVEAGLRSAFDVVVVVTAGEAGRVARLATDRGMSEKSVRSRIASQASDEERLSVADHVIRNDGTIGELERQVDGLWEFLQQRLTRG